MPLERGQRVDRLRRDQLLVVREGLVAVSVILSDGRRQILCLNTPGESICPVCSNDCWIEALTPSLLDTSPINPGNGAMEDLFRLTHNRLISANTHLLTLGRFDGAERVAAFIVDMCRRLGRPVGKAGATLHLPMTRDDIADYLGLNAETVSRLFSRLKKSKIALFPTPTEIIVPDLAALEARAPIKPGEGFHARKTTVGATSG